MISWVLQTSIVNDQLEAFLGTHLGPILLLPEWQTRVRHQGPTEGQVGEHRQCQERRQLRHTLNSRHQPAVHQGLARPMVDLWSRRGGQSGITHAPFHIDQAGACTLSLAGSYHEFEDSNLNTSMVAKLDNDKHPSVRKHQSVRSQHCYVYIS